MPLAGSPLFRFRSPRPSSARIEAPERRPENGKEKHMTAKVDIYTRITNRIISDLEKGTRPWLKPWNAEHAAGRITRPLRHNANTLSRHQCSGALV